MWLYLLQALLAIVLAGLLFREWRVRLTLRRRSTALESLYDVGRAMTSTLDFSSLLQQIMTLSMETIGSETASVVLADEESDDLVLVCSHGLPENVKPGARFPAARGGVAGWVYRSGQPLILHGSVSNDPRFQSEATRGSIRSALSVPLIGKRGPIGVLSLNNSTRRDAFKQHDLDLLTSIAAQAGIAVENARLHRQLEEANESLTVTVEHLRNLKSSLTSMTAPSLEDSPRVHRLTRPGGQDGEDPHRRNHPHQRLFRRLHAGQRSPAAVHRP